MRIAHGRTVSIDLDLCYKDAKVKIQQELKVINGKPICIFDWDGVIVPSNDWKWRDMWPEIFPDDEAKSANTVEILKTPKGRALNRVELLKKVFEADSVTQEVQAAIDRFGEVAVSGVRKLGAFPGVKEMLDGLHGDGFLMHVITGSAQTDVIQLAGDIGVSEFFGSIRGFVEGAGLGKYDNYLAIERELATAGLDTNDPDTFVVIGDGDSDRNLAEQIGCRFIAVSNEWNGWAGQDDFEFLVSDPADVDEILIDLGKQ